MGALGRSGTAPPAPRPRSLPRARVANNLGAGNARGARLVYRVAVALTAVICCSVSGVIFAGRHSLVTMYTKDPATVALGLRVVPVVSLSLLGERAPRLAHARVPPLGIVQLSLTRSQTAC